MGPSAAAAPSEPLTATAAVTATDATAAASAEAAAAAPEWVTLPPASALDYDLPEERIATRPAEPRDSSLLLVTDASGTCTGDASHQEEDTEGPSVQDARFQDLGRYLPEGSLLVLNQSRVITARLLLAKEGTGGRAEVLCIRPVAPAPDPAVALAAPSGQSVWQCMIGGKKIRPGSRLTMAAELPGGGGGGGARVDFVASVEARDGKDGLVRFSWTSADPRVRSMRFGQVLEAVGKIPLPPYMHRASDAADATDYQTVYAKAQGSVAAPTAGLHFTEELLGRMQAGPPHISPCYLTLHVGAGTFQPVSGEDVGAHAMHWERVSVPLTTLEQLIDASGRGRPIVPVGTTSVRTLESLYWWGARRVLRPSYHTDSDAAAAAAGSVTDLTLGQWEPYQLGVARPGGGAKFPPAVEALESLRQRARAEGADAVGGETQLMVAPGYRFALCDGLVTNFHQPRSTLLLLVGALLGGLRPVHRVYAHALRAACRYRFLSFGDSNLMVPPPRTLLGVRRQGLGPVAWPWRGRRQREGKEGWTRLGKR